MEMNITIDTLMGCLICNETGEECDTEYRLVSRTITKQDAYELNEQGWRFDWSVPHRKGYEVYELLLENDDEVQGMIALKHIREHYYTHVDIAEAAPDNVGRNGKYRGVGAHLFAIACKLSWDAGNEGYVQFTVNFSLLEHYNKTLGAKITSWSKLYIDSYGAIALINKYFKVVNGLKNQRIFNHKFVPADQSLQVTERYGISMIVAERNQKVMIDKFDKFGEEMSDGRLTMPSDGKIYRLREVILLSKQLGRRLAQEEISQFEVQTLLPEAITDI